MKRFLSMFVIGALLALGVMYEAHAGYSSRGYSSGRSYSSPSRSYASPSKSYSSPSYSPSKTYTAPPTTYKSPSYSPSKAYAPVGSTSADIKTPRYSPSTPLSNTTVVHHYYDSGPSFGGGHFWFWMWALNAGHSNQPVIVNAGTPAASVAGGTGSFAPVQKPNPWEQFFVVLANFAILLGFIALIWWLIVRYQKRHI